MWLFSLCLVVLVSSKTIGGSSCLVETLKCSRLRPALPTHKSLFVSPTQMNVMCRQQAQYFKCLDNIMASEETADISLTSTLQDSRKLFKELCSSNSRFQTKYLELAPCINEQHLEFCTDGKFFAGSTRDSQDACSLREKAVNCITVTLAMKCGMEAGKIFLRLLKLATDGEENCYVVGSDILSLPELQEAKIEDISMDSYDEPLVNLLDSIGTLLGETMTRDYSLPDTGESTDHDEVICKNDYLKYVLSSNVDSRTDSKLPDTCITPRLGFHDSPSPEDSEKIDTDKPPEFLESVIRFNSKNSLSNYIRSPSLDFGEFAFCEKSIEGGKEIYICTEVLRVKSPVCLEGGRTRNVTGIHPEDIDPELGAELYPMFPYAYYFGSYEEMYERMFKRIHELNNGHNRASKFRSASETAEGMQAKDSATENMQYLDIEQDSELGSDSLFTDAFYYSNLGSKVNDGKVDGKNKRSIDGTLRGYVLGVTAQRDGKPRTLGELIASYFMPVTASRDGRRPRAMKESSTVTTSPYDNTENLTKEQKILYDIYREEIWWVMHHASKPPGVQSEWVSSNSVRHKYYAREGSRFVNMTCGRVNECHPNATDVHKCLYYFSVDEEMELETLKRPSVSVREPRIASRSRQHGEHLIMESDSDSRSFGLDILLERFGDIPVERSKSENLEYILIGPDGSPVRIVEAKAADPSMDERDGEVTFEYKPRFEATSARVQELRTSLDKLKKLLDNTAYVIGED